MDPAGPARPASSVGLDRLPAFGVRPPLPPLPVSSGCHLWLGLDDGKGKGSPFLGAFPSLGNQDLILSDFLFPREIRVSPV